ncbi:hypothetical protein O181_073131 [Austropuccinia psidii MF-1]|uniref:Uncharacterized protein n=1 Tax=Austropuccinia psidii MF-1 TaxID=1389203 RepID=A0A9Q3F406_9BASI|nr:hypothetical protein [Austropuccinia psidii MF-1]
MQLFAFCFLTSFGFFTRSSVLPGFNHLDLNRRAIFGSCLTPVISLIDDKGWFLLIFFQRADLILRRFFIPRRIGTQKFASKQSQFQAPATETIKETADAICVTLNSTCVVGKDLISQCQAASKAAQLKSDRKIQVETFNKLMDIGGLSTANVVGTNSSTVVSKKNVTQSTDGITVKNPATVNPKKNVTESGKPRKSNVIPGGTNETANGTHKKSPKTVSKYPFSLKLN